MKPKGHIRDTQRPAGLVHHDRLVGDVIVPPVARLWARIDDQRGQDCTGSYALNVETWCHERGIQCDPVSRRFSYTLGRQLAAPDEPLRDVGANPNSVVEGMRIFGVVPEAEFPGDEPTVINTPVALFDLEVARTFVVQDIAVIEDTGAERCAAIRRAIAAKLPVAFGADIDQSFEDLQAGQTYGGPKGPSVGGHAMRVLGYRPGAFLIGNSWGEGWADAGYCWVTDEWLGGPFVFDVYCLNFAKAVYA